MKDLMPESEAVWYRVTRRFRASAPAYWRDQVARVPSEAAGRAAVAAPMPAGCYCQILDRVEAATPARGNCVRLVEIARRSR